MTVTSSLTTAVNVAGGNLLRLSKIISSTGIVSRRQAESIIARGRVTVDGVKVTNGFELHKQSANIILDGLPLHQQKKKGNDSNAKGLFKEIPRLFICNKLNGEVVSLTDNQRKRPVIYDRLKSQMVSSLRSSGSSDSSSLSMESMIPVTRLDFMTEGLQLFTNNGLLAKTLIKASFTSAYRMRVNGLITQDKLRGLSKGLVIDGVKQSSFEITIDKKLKESSNSWIKLSSKSTAHSLQSMKRSFQKLYLKPTRIICLKFGPYSLTDVPDAIGWKEVALTEDISNMLRQARLTPKTTPATAAASVKKEQVVEEFEA